MQRFLLFWSFGHVYSPIPPKRIGFDGRDEMDGFVCGFALASVPVWLGDAYAGSSLLISYGCLDI